jgi:hypothetical protein
LKSKRDIVFTVSVLYCVFIYPVRYYPHVLCVYRSHHVGRERPHEATSNHRIIGGGGRLIEVLPFLVLAFNFTATRRKLNTVLNLLLFFGWIIVTFFYKDSKFYVFSLKTSEKIENEQQSKIDCIDCVYCVALSSLVVLKNNSDCICMLSKRVFLLDLHLPWWVHL